MNLYFRYVRHVVTRLDTKGGIVPGLRNYHNGVSTGIEEIQHGAHEEYLHRGSRAVGTGVFQYWRCGGMAIIGTPGFGVRVSYAFINKETIN